MNEFGLEHMSCSTFPLSKVGRLTAQQTSFLKKKVLMCKPDSIRWRIGVVVPPLGRDLHLKSVSVHSERGNRRL